MIVNTRDTKLVDISGVILIDCWEPNGTQDPEAVVSLNKFYKSLRDHLSLLKPKIVVDATMYYETSSLSQTLTPWVESHVNFKCTTMDEFETLRHQQRKILDSKLKNWLVVGLEWQLCAHCNNLGLLSLARMINLNNKKINVFGTDWGFWKWDRRQQWSKGNCEITAQHYINDFLTWQICKKGYYRLLDIDEPTWRKLQRQYSDLDPQ
jgi:hypothetical protein